MAFSKAGEETTPHGDPSRRLNGEGRGGGDDDLARKTRGREGRESWGVNVGWESLVRDWNIRKGATKM